MNTSESWTLSSAAIAAVERAIVDFARDYAAPEFAYYPLITWRSGGTATRLGSTPVSLPDRYDLALIKQVDVGASNFIPISSPRFGVVAFVPSDQDAASSRRLIDYDGKNIVVR